MMQKIEYVETIQVCGLAKTKIKKLKIFRATFLEVFLKLNTVR